MTAPAFRERLVFPLDYPDLDAARRGAEPIVESAGVLKVGLELFVREGPRAVSLAKSLGCEVFLDLKLHDIPATVERAVASAASLGARYLTVHASGGVDMVRNAVARAHRENPDLRILAVTVLTSLGAHDLHAMNVVASPSEHALKLALLAAEAGASGFVCSPAEVGTLRQRLGTTALLVVPGIRPAGSASDDQKRVGTPRDAVLSGADLLVVGRPIRDAADPAAAARGVLVEIADAEAERRARG